MILGRPGLQVSSCGYGNGGGAQEGTECAFAMRGWATGGARKVRISTPCAVVV